MEKVKVKTVPKNQLTGAAAIVRKAMWESMREEFLELSITNQGVHWPTLAAKYGVSPEVARNKASIKKWYADVGAHKEARENILEAKLTERTTLALDKLTQDFATNEASIRKRHATMARGLQVRAITRIKEIDLKDLTARDALFMLKLGIDEERFALGMPQVYSGAKAHDPHDEFKPLVEQMGGHQKVQKIGMLLLNALKNTNLEDAGLGEATDINEISDVDAVGLGPVNNVPGPIYDPLNPPVYQPVPEAIMPVPTQPAPVSGITVKKAKT